jgi:hypothetical protein
MVRTSNISRWTFSYAQFRAATELSKKEADRWVQTGVIQAGPAEGRGRAYSFESIFEGLIAKQLADFSSRELLPQTMSALRKCLQEEKITMAKIEPNTSGPRLCVQIYTRRSQEIMPGGGVRGVVSYVKLYGPSATAIGKAVFVVVDLTLVALLTWNAIRGLLPG